MDFEYRVIPAPTKGKKQRGIRKPDDRFAFALQDSMNEMAALGWEFIRSETLPNTERTGLTRKTTTDRTMLVFRRPVPAAAPTSSLEATLRESEKPKPQPIPAEVPAAAAPVAEVPEPPKAPAPQQAPVTSNDDTVVALQKAPAPKPQDRTATPPAEAPATIVRPDAPLDEISFPAPRPKEPLRAESQALYTKDVEKPAKRAKSNALPAALRSRASQSQDGKKA